METLDTLLKFVKKYPQKDSGKLQYSFVGGTAIRLVQEKMNSSEKRIVSDFDLLNLGNKGYPVHTINPSIVFGLPSLSIEEVSRYIEDVKIKNQKYYFMDGSFLSFSKSCAIDTPREKDYVDVNFLYHSHQINQDKLNSLFDKSNLINNEDSIAQETFNWFFEDSSQDKVLLYQSFARFVNLISDFESPEKARNYLLNYVSRNRDKRGYEVSSIVYDMHSVLKEFSDLPEKSKLGLLKTLGRYSSKNSYVDFNRKVHMELIPKARYSFDKVKSVRDSLI